MHCTMYAYDNHMLLLKFLDFDPLVNQSEKGADCQHQVRIIKCLKKVMSFFMVFINIVCLNLNGMHVCIPPHCCTFKCVKLYAL